MQDELKAIQRRVGTTFIHVTHDQEEAMAIADRIVVMNAGRIEDQGSPARVYARPATLFTADFMGEINQIPGQATGNGVETPFGSLPHPAQQSGTVTVCIRPEAISTGDGPVWIGPARVTDAAFFGTHCRAHLVPDCAPDLTLIAHLPPRDLPEAGARLILSTDIDACSVFMKED
ncbi:MAG: TOBE domain-containing protein [Pseudomonadota bacterium]